MKMAKRILKGGTLVTGEGSFAADILLEEGKIAAVGTNLSAPGAEAIDVSGALLFPGGVDIHTHLDAPLAGTVTTDDFETGSIAAAFGGTTTLVDYALHSKGQSLKSAVNDWKARAEGKAVIDYGLHVSVVELNESIIKEIPELISEGVTSFKVFTVYRGALMIDDASFFKLLRLTKKYKGLVMVHAETGDVIDAFVEEALAAGNTAPKYHALTRPVETEEDSIAHCIELAKIARAPLFIVHVSTENGLKKVMKAQSMGLEIYAETCPHYLYLGHEVYEQPGFEGAKYVCSPPIRDRYHSKFLWDGLRNGTIQVLASDHCPFTFKQKHLGEENFTKIPNGVPSLEARFILGYHGATEGKLSLPQFVNAVSAAPAKFAGIYPQKGSLMPGSDADIVVLDPAGQTLLSIDNMHERNDYTPYEGMRVNGKISSVLVRGEFVIQEGKMVAAKGFGKYLKRGTYKL